MILYFSGTGNSQYVAELINEVQNDQLVNINALLLEKKEINFSSDKPYVFVCPTYAWKIPKIVEEFIKQHQFSPDQKVYFMMTCGEDIGNAGKYNQQLAKLKGLEYMGTSSVVMPENFITMFKAPDNPKAVIEQAIEPIDTIATVIKNKQRLKENKINILDYLKSSIVNMAFYPLFVKAKGFYATDKCIGCNKCVQVCPLNNIEIAKNAPKWHNQCTQCMACIARCPKQAIEYKRRSRGKKRYYLDDNLKKEINANRHHTR